MLLEPNASPGDRYKQKYEDKENYMAAWPFGACQITGHAAAW